MHTLLERDQLRKDSNMSKHITIDQADLEACMFGTANYGICLACGDLADGCEPDARQYKCEACGERKVYGLEEALIMGVEVL